MGYNVLVVDDSRVVRAMVIKTVRLAQVDLNKVFEAEDGKEALRILDKEWVDLVFADINMPVMDGIEMVDAMADKDMLEMIPVVIISTERSATRMEELKAKGVRAYLNKPFTPENIKKVLEDILGNREEEEP